MTKTIQLTQGFIATVDDIDYEYLRQFKWEAQRGRSAVYARRWGEGTTRVIRIVVIMHRVIAERMGLKIDGLMVDHKDFDGLNNRRNNLRVATHMQNRWNHKPRQNKSGYLGVYRTPSGKWQANIVYRGECVNVGLFDDAISAAHARDDAAKKYHGEFARLNFGDKSDTK